jgi:hypothetical protein
MDADVLHALNNNENEYSPVLCAAVRKSPNFFALAKLSLETVSDARDLKVDLFSLS